MAAALAAALLGAGVIAAPAYGVPTVADQLGISPASTLPEALDGPEVADDHQRDLDELNDSIQDFAEELLDAHADAVTAAADALEQAADLLAEATTQTEAAAVEAADAQEAADQARRAFEGTERAERAASRRLAELTAQVAETRDRLGEVARTAYQAGGGGLVGWSALLQDDGTSGLEEAQESPSGLLRAGDEALGSLRARLAELQATRDQVRSLRAEHQRLGLRVTDSEAAAAAAQAALDDAEDALEQAERAHTTAQAEADAARDEEYRQYQDFLAESEALEAWLAEYSLTDTLEGTGSFIRPGTGGVTSPFGPRRHPILGYVKVHTGIDLGRGDGFIYAADHGVVAEATWNDAYGYLVIVDHGVIDGRQVSTLYAHQPGLSVDIGDQVAKGQPIGTVGSTGLSTGPHLHFEVRIAGRPVDPWSWISAAPLPDEADQ